ncbi:DUF4082 domain-containing protein [Saccharothrix sp. HUAS TT1]|uniref:DUF4082 domain-containing protein n=1 Tax=unclassified Saccharothrix TaxID=2593673 RepID=UPI00345C4037
MVVVVALASMFFGTPVASAGLAWTGFSTPHTGAHVEVGEPLLITGTSGVGEGSNADATEITLDNGATWLPVDGNWPWRFLYTPTAPGDVTVTVRAAYNGDWTVGSQPLVLHVGTPGVLAPVYCPCTSHVHESAVADVDRLPVELGARVRVDRPGRLTGVHLKRGAYQGPITVRVWGPGGALLHQQEEATVTQPFLPITFTTPVPVSTGAEYVVSYYTPEGGYVAAEDFHIGTVIRAPFVIPRDAGVYRYGEGGGFPTESWNASSYSIHPVFEL